MTDTFRDINEPINEPELLCRALNSLLAASDILQYTKSTSFSSGSSHIFAQYSLQDVKYHMALNIGCPLCLFESLTRPIMANDKVQFVFAPKEELFVEQWTPSPPGR